MGPLKDGVLYVDGWGNTHRVAGDTKDYPGIVWTIGGNWFRRSDGRACRTSIPNEQPTNWDLQAVAEEPEEQSETLPGMES